MNKAKHYIILGILQRLELIASLEGEDDYSKQETIDDVKKLASDIVSFVYEIEENKF